MKYSSKNSALHWLPWLSKLGITLESSQWREVAKKLNNKGLIHLKDFWDDSSSQWLDIGELRQCHCLSLFEDVLISRLLSHLDGRPSPLCMPSCTWKCWLWPIQRPFKSPNTKEVYLRLQKPPDWVQAVNKAWECNWPTQRWSMVIHRLWSFKLDDHKKFFMWKIIMGAIPTRVKAAVRGLGSDVCAGCKAAVKAVLHLFHGCPCLQHLGAHLCSSWISKVWNVHISRYN